MDVQIEGRTLFELKAATVLNNGPTRINETSRAFYSLDTGFLRENLKRKREWVMKPPLTALVHADEGNGRTTTTNNNELRNRKNKKITPNTMPTSNQSLKFHFHSPFFCSATHSKSHVNARNSTELSTQHGTLSILVLIEFLI